MGSEYTIFFQNYFSLARRLLTQQEKRVSTGHLASQYRSLDASSCEMPPRFTSGIFLQMRGCHSEHFSKHELYGHLVALVK